MLNVTVPDKCKRRLFSGYTCGAPEKKNVESPVKHMEEKCSGI